MSERKKTLRQRLLEKNRQTELEEALEDLGKWWQLYGGKLPYKQYVALGDILERIYPQEIENLKEKR